MYMFSIIVDYNSLNIFYIFATPLPLSSKERLRGNLEEIVNRICIYQNSQYLVVNF